MGNLKFLSGVKHPSEDETYRECSFAKISMMQNESLKLYTAENKMSLSQEDLV